MKKRMTLKQFTAKFKAELDEYIQNQSPGAPRNDEERRLWVLNDAGLSRWARSEGTRV